MNIPLILSGATLVLLIVLLMPVEDDFYPLHVMECNDAHDNNMAYLFCSGFYIEPHPDYNLPGGCPVINPGESCEEQVPHGSAIGSTHPFYEDLFGAIK
jgi:hypothetical protein